MDNSKNAIPRWEKPDGSPVSCTEKVMVLNENYEELRSMIKDALEDALVLGCIRKAGSREFPRLLSMKFSLTSKNVSIILSFLVFY